MSNDNYQVEKQFEEFPSVQVILKKRKRKPKWNRIIIAILLLLVLILSSMLFVNNKISEKKKISENDQQTGFIEEQKKQQVLDFVASYDEDPQNATKIDFDNSEKVNTIENPAYVWGIDISHWHEYIVTQEWFSKAKEAGCRFVYIQFAKTSTNTENNPVLDYSEIAIQFSDAAEKIGLNFGFYFLTDAANETQRLAEFATILKFLTIAEGKNYQYLSFPLMLDHEVYGPEEPIEKSDSRVKMLEKQVYELNQIGIQTIIYTSSSKYEELHEKLGDKQYFWLANWSSPKGEVPKKFLDGYEDVKTVSIWQYTNDDLTLQERDLSVEASYLPNKQQSLDRNLMKVDFYDTFAK